MQKDQQKLEQLIKGKKVAFIGAGVSHKTLIKEFVELGAHVTLCDQKKSVEDFGDYAATIRELGIALSLVFDGQVDSLNLLGNIYINLITALVAPLIFVSIISSITYVGSLKKLRSIGSNIRIEAVRRLGYRLEVDETC